VRRILSLLLVAAAFGDPASAASRLLSAGSTEAPWRLRLDAAGARIEGAGSKALRLALPTGGGVDAFVATSGGWLAVGSEPVTGGRDLALWTGDEDGAIPVAPPPGRQGAVRAFAVPLLRTGELVGLAWLEGEAADRFAVWASARDGQRWAAPVQVAPPGPGSQLALTAAVLADGSWLLAWSAYDGEDDEVVWSLRREGRWTSPQAVADGNQVPDVTPALRAAGSGALLAWSRYDGNDYRLLVARMSGGRWQAPELVGSAGTILPRWEGEALVFRDAAHGAWVAASVDAHDQLRLETAAAAPPEPRPVLARRDGALHLLFP
jgi:hypothetical protein